MPLSFFAGLHSAELMSRIVTDVNRLARVSSTVLVMAFRQIAMVIALLSVMLVREWRLALIALVIFPFVGVAVRSIGRRLYRINKRSQEKVAELNVLLHEAFSGTKIVKAFGREGHEAERFARVNGRLLDLALKDHRTDEITEPLMEVLAAFGIMGALWYGGHQVIAGAMTPGDFFSFTAAMALIYGPVRQLSRILNTVQQSASSVERVFEILDQPPAIADRPDAHALPGFHQALRFEDVSFRYPGSPEPHAARHHAGGPARRGGGLRGDERGGQVDADRSGAALPRRHQRAHHRSTGTTCATSPRPRCAPRSRW